MVDDPGRTPGEFRVEPVWIGGGFTPVGATFVGPRHELIPEAIGDLIVFTRRADVPALAQIAVGHAQFETIHPFIDGNGRTGRALVQAMLRNKGLTRQVTVPVSAGLLADTAAYFAARSDSTVWKVADLLTRRPVVNAALLAQELGIESANAHRYLNPLTEVGILVEATNGPRNRVWRSPEVLAALDAFAERAGRRG
ncbi:hypothetical protein BH10ACT9_BH10ACT9_37560 [soil metagenome]